MPAFIHKNDSGVYHRAVTRGVIVESDCRVSLATSRPRQSTVVLIEDISTPVGKVPCAYCFDVDEPEPEPESFVCDICDDWATTSKGAYTRHMNSQH